MKIDSSLKCFSSGYFIRNRTLAIAKKYELVK